MNDAEAAALQAELARLSSTCRRACREADDTLAATPDVDPPDALLWRRDDFPRSNTAEPHPIRSATRSAARTAPAAARGCDG